jgi:hypothetical protein
MPATTCRLLGLALVIAGADRPCPLTAQDSLVIARAERVGTLRDTALGESSGVAISRTHAGVLWTHNDSGDSARIYAITRQGDLLASYRVPGAAAEDWEDVSLGICPTDDSACLYLADTGDNRERRENVQIYIVREPARPGPGGPTMRETAPARRVTVRYPDGPHDVEAAAVDPAGDLYLVTKGRAGPIRLYRLSREVLRGDSATALLVDTLPIEPLQTLGRWVTSAAFSPGGSRLVVRTYTELYFFRRGPGGTFEPVGAPCWLGAAEPQGEAVDFIDESAVLLTSESVGNRLGPVLRVTCDSGGGATR